MVIEIKKEESPYNGLWLWDKSYSLGDKAFTDEMKRTVLRQTGLKYGNMSDWWVSAKSSKPEYSWKQLIQLAFKILNSEATEAFVSSMWLQEIPNYEIKDVEPLELSIHSVSGAKRINASAQLWDGNNKISIGSKFVLSGKDQSCCVEGTWFHWVCFACNILASENTKICCPEAHCLELKIANY